MRLWMIARAELWEALQREGEMLAEVLLSDFDLWAGFVLNNDYVTLTEAEHDAWEALQPGEQTREAQQQSWERIFALDYPEGDPEWVGSLHAEHIQATFEVLRLHDVVRVTHFRSRRAERRYRLAAGVSIDASQG